MNPPGQVRPELPPPSLLTECDAGPELPAGAPATVEELAYVVKARDKAAAACRARHKALSGWAVRAATPE